MTHLYLPPELQTCTCNHLLDIATGYLVSTENFLCATEFLTFTLHAGFTVPVNDAAIHPLAQAPNLGAILDCPFSLTPSASSLSPLALLSKHIMTDTFSLLPQPPTYTNHHGLVRSTAVASQVGALPLFLRLTVSFPHSNQRSFQNVNPVRAQNPPMKDSSPQQSLKPSHG